MTLALFRSPFCRKSSCYFLTRICQVRMCDSLATEGRAPRKVRIYTRTGDAGKSSLYNGRREVKDSLYFFALGDVDELNSVTGMANEYCHDLVVKFEQDSLSNSDKILKISTLMERLKGIQSRLMDIGTAIATPITQSSEEQLARAEFDETALQSLEEWIDDMDSELPPLRNFILPVSIRTYLFIL